MICIHLKFTFCLLEKAVHIFRDLLNIKAVPGEDAELSCEITKADVTMRWLKDGHLIRQSPKYEMSVVKNLAKLVIRNAAIRDSGDYCCEADGVASRAKVEIRGTLIFLWSSLVRVAQLCLSHVKPPLRTPTYVCEGAEGVASRRKGQSDPGVRDQAAGQAGNLAEGHGGAEVQQEVCHQTEGSGAVADHQQSGEIRHRYLHM